jgi:hypothetical protein
VLNAVSFLMLASGLIAIALMRRGVAQAAR